MSRSPTNSPSTAIADTGASSHYIRPNDPHVKTNIPQQPITVGLPNGAQLTSTNDGCHLAIPQLPSNAREAHIIPGLTHSSLISIGKLCDSGCIATFNQRDVKITKNNELLLTGNRDHHTGL